MIHYSADIDEGTDIHPSAFVWQYAHVRSGAKIGEKCVIGRGAYIGPGVTIGANSKVQNYALVYEPAVVGDGVFIGPAVVLTNDTYPRAINSDGSPKTANDWEAVGVTIREGASIGARAVCVAPITIGCWAMIAAGAVVTRSVPDHALVAGAPAKQIGWVSKAGFKMQETRGGGFVCPRSGETFRPDQSGFTEEA